MKILWTIVLLPLFLQAEINAEQASQDEATEATTCDLVLRPADFQNKLVRVKGLAQAGFEVLALVDENCPADNMTAGVVWLTREGSGVVKYSGGWSLRDFLEGSRNGQLDVQTWNHTWVIPLQVPIVEDDQSRRFAKRLRRSNGGLVEVVLLGRFDFAPHGMVTMRLDGRYYFSSGFGHLGGYSKQLVIARVESVGKTHAEQQPHNSRLNPTVGTVTPVAEGATAAPVPPAG